MNMYDHDLILPCGESCTSRQNLKFQFQTLVGSMQMCLTVKTPEKPNFKPIYSIHISDIENGIHSIFWQRSLKRKKMVG